MIGRNASTPSLLAEAKKVATDAGVIAKLCASLSIVMTFSAFAQSSEPRWTPPTNDPRDFEGVWLPGGYANASGDAAKEVTNDKGGPPTESGGLGPPPGAALPPGNPGAPPAPETPDAAVGGTLSCTPVQRLRGAGGGMSNLWIQGPKEILMISEEDMDVRKIYLNATHPKKFKPQPNGHSIGHWEGNTLVVDSIGFAKPDGSDRGQHVVERFHKDGKKLIDQLTITEVDGKTHTETAVASWRSDLRVYENVCEENFNRFRFENGELIDE